MEIQIALVKSAKIIINLREYRSAGMPPTGLSTAWGKRAIVPAKASFVILHVGSAIHHMITN